MAKIASQVNGVGSVEFASAVLPVQKISDKLIANKWRHVRVANGGVLYLWNEDVLFKLFLFLLRLVIRGHLLELFFFLLLLLLLALFLRATAMPLFFFSLESLHKFIGIVHISFHVVVSSLHPAPFIKAVAVKEDEAESLLVEVLIDHLGDVVEVDRKHVVHRQLLTIVVIHGIELLGGLGLVFLSRLVVVGVLLVFVACSVL